MEAFDFLVLSFQSSLCKRKIFSKKKNMEAVEVMLEDILSCKEIPIVRLKSYAINAFVMGYHVYKKNWSLSSETSYRVSSNQQINWKNMQ